MSDGPGAAANDGADSDARALVAGLVDGARAAMACLRGADQARVDEAVMALAWSLYKPENARALAELAVAETGLGNVADKIVKNRRKTFGALRDLMRVKSVGAIAEDPAAGIVRFAKPVGVVGAVTPSTNPAATPINKAMMALKGANAVIVAPSPSGWAATARAVALARGELGRIGLDPDLVQVLPRPVTKALTQALMEQADLVVVTGSQDNVRRAYSSGTPAIGVGVGNVPVIVDSTADLADAAAKIAASKCFDNATSCSSENALVILDDVYDDALRALEAAGGYLASPAESARIVERLWVGGRLNRHAIARNAAVAAEVFGLPEAAQRQALLHLRGGRYRPWPSAVGREAFAGARGLPRRRFRRGGRHRARPSRAPGDRAFLRYPHGRPGPCPTPRRDPRRGPRAGQPGPLLRQRRQLRQRPQLHPVHGLRKLGGQLDQREPELAPLHQRHPSGDDDTRGQAQRGGAVRRLPGEVRAMRAAP